jgi:hypothetical protein
MVIKKSNNEERDKNMEKEQSINSQDMEKIREIPKWSRKYAQNRSLTILILLGMCVLIGFFAVVPLLLILAGLFYRNIILVFVGVIALVAFIVFYKSLFKKYGGENRGLIDQLIDRKIYGKDGVASMPIPKRNKKTESIGIVFAVVFCVCMLANVILCVEGYISIKYMQPISVLYVIPFLVFQYYDLRPKVGPLILISPVLYTIHAILIVTDVPIYYFSGALGFLNILLPIYAYTSFAYLISHIYSRYALKKLKTVAHLRETNHGQ